VDDGAFVGGDGVGSVLEGGADVLDGGLAGLDVEGRGFEEDVGTGGGEPAFDVRGRSPQGLKPFLFVGLIGTAETMPFPLGALGESDGGVNSIVVGDPSQAARGDSGDAE
jgi:hypothetical protein